MLKVNTYLSASSIHGIGVFAMEAIPSGSVIFAEETYFTNRYPVELVDSMPAAARNFIRGFGYLRDGVYKLSVDNDRFMNHSDTPNTRESADNLYTFAVRDIRADEEITADYNAFCDNKWP
jgi:SET domain-containing protein